VFTESPLSIGSIRYNILPFQVNEIFATYLTDGQSLLRSGFILKFSAAKIVLSQASTWTTCAFVPLDMTLIGSQRRFRGCDKNDEPQHAANLSQLNKTIGSRFAFVASEE
jgi:hypothetical protein